MPRERWFEFRDPTRGVIATAGDLAEFSHMLRVADPSVVAHHLERGDFSRWITGTMQDRTLGAAVGAVERDVLARPMADIRRARERVLDEVQARYPEGG